MSVSPLIVLLAGARETHMAAQWLAATPASVRVVWARGVDRMGPWRARGRGRAAARSWDRGRHACL